MNNAKHLSVSSLYVVLYLDGAFVPICNIPWRLETEQSHLNSFQFGSCLLSASQNEQAALSAGIQQHSREGWLSNALFEW